MALSNLSPINRLEKFLNKIAGVSVSISAITRKEFFLNKIAEKAANDRSRITTLEGKNFLPNVTSSDAGKVATVNSSGVWVAGEPAGSNTPTCKWTLEYSGGTWTATPFTTWEWYLFAGEILNNRDAITAFECTISDVDYSGDCMDRYAYDDDSAHTHVVVRILLPISGSSATLLSIDTKFDYDPDSPTYNEYVTVVTSKTIALT